MTLAPRLQSFLDECGVAYLVIPHQPSSSSRAAAEAAHVPVERLAKAVLLKDDQGYLLVVLPASRRIALDRLREQLGRDLELASEPELAAIFADCDAGAAPPFGGAYGIPTVIDESLLHLSDVYFEAGSHACVARMTGADFASQFSGRPRGAYSYLAGPRDVTESLRGKEPRDLRLAEELVHVFSLRAYGAGLRAQSEFERNGHTGMLLMKTPELRVVLEAMAPGTSLATHVVHSPATLFVIEGALDVSTADGVSRVGEGEMASLPRDERREIRAPVRALFLLALARTLTREEALAARPQPRRVLIVAHQTAGGEHLLDAARERVALGPCEFVPLAPALQARPRLIREVDTTADAARARLERAAARLRELGAPVRCVLGDFYPLRAVADTLLTADFDEIIVSTRPAPLSEWLKLDLPTRVWRRFGIPVTHVVSRE